jgi:uncharacterized protein (TIGR02246 family)
MSVRFKNHLISRDHAILEMLMRLGMQTLACWTSAAGWTSAASAVVLALAAGAFAQEAAPSVDATDAIRRQAEIYVQAYNAHDAARVAACWAEDAVYIHPESGERVTGRDAIQKLFEESFAADPSLRIEVAIDGIRLLGESAAVEDGRATILAEGVEP